MEIDWQSEETHVLINPRIPSDKHDTIKKLLLSCELPGHLWIATSGSSATKIIPEKWVALSKKAILASANGVNLHLGASCNDCWMQALPTFHVGGASIYARAQLLGVDVFDYQLEVPKWSPRSFHHYCHMHRSTLTALVPTQLYDLVQENLQAPPFLRATVIGGGKLDEWLYLEAKNLGWSPLPSFGMTECASQIATATLQSLDDTNYPKLELLPHINSVTLNHEGCLKVKSPCLLTCYGILHENGVVLVDPKKEGWLQTEDLVDIERPAIIPKGRKTDVVKIKGENVNVAALNDKFRSIAHQLGISGEQVIIAIPHKRNGNELYLVEAKTVSSDLSATIERYNESVLPFEKIQNVHHFDSIPKTSLNKIKTKYIQQQLSELLRPNLPPKPQPKFF